MRCLATWQPVTSRASAGLHASVAAAHRDSLICWPQHDHSYAMPAMCLPSQFNVAPSSPFPICAGEHLLHERNLREAAALHAQLLRLLPAQGLAAAKALSPPAVGSVDAAVSVRLRRAILSGSLDQVCIHT